MIKPMGQCIEDIKKSGINSLNVSRTMVTHDLVDPIQPFGAVVSASAVANSQTLIGVRIV